MTVEAAQIRAGDAPAAAGPNPDPAMIVARALELAPLFGERAAEAEALRRMPDDLVAELRRSGLLRIMQPEGFGGYQHGPIVMADAVREIAAASGSAGWLYALTALHNWVAGLFEKAAQEEIFAATQDPVISVVFAPTGTAEAGEGGYRLSGQWKYCTGSPHADWIVVNGRVSGPDGVQIRCFLVPREDFEVKDSWQVTGLRGTGSNDVVIENAFVPAHRTLDFEDVHAGTTSGAAEHDDPIYRIPSTPLLSHVAASVAIGILIGATREYEARAKTRLFTFDRKPQSNQAGSQMRLARALSIARSCTALQRDLFEKLVADAASGAAAEPLYRAELRMYAAYIVDICQKMVAELYQSAGSNAIFESSPMQRAFRDIHALSTHVAVAYDEAAETFGQMRLGYDPKSGMI